MHIPEWDARFLAQYDPRTLADAYERAGATSVMFYCQSHVGLCYFPTKTGKQHPALNGRDIVTETLTLLREKNIAAVGYYSVNYNDWAFWEYPAWRTVPAGDKAADSLSHSRYGTLCLNQPVYRAFVLAQLNEIVEGRKFDGFFVDDSFWSTVCVCAECRKKYRAEAGVEIPQTVDWFDPAWCHFQTTREQWLSDYVGEITAHLKQLDPTLSVHHNFGVAMGHWSFGVPFESSVHHDFLGGDLFGDPIEQLMVSKWMTNLTQNRPMEFMTSHTIGVREHVQLKSLEQLRLQAHAATLLSSAFLFIDWINPDGTINSKIYDRIGHVYSETCTYEPYLGGEAVQDIAIYFSYDAKVDFADNGRALSDINPWSENFRPPHVRAIRGVVRALQRAHLPFGIITSKQLNELDRYKVIILPNVLRMNVGEVNALREYVRCGGAVYASRYSSLIETSGVMHSDFMLADVFGCHFDADDIGSTSYLKPARADVGEWIAPQNVVTLSNELVMFGPNKDKPDVKPLRLQERGDGEVMGTLTLPYSNESSGTVFDHHWSSIHSSPPWQDTAHPALVYHLFGQGSAIYSAADIESLDADVPQTLFTHLIQQLLQHAPSYSTDAPPAVWMNVQQQLEQNRLTVGFLNYQAQLPVIPIQRFAFTLQPQRAQKFVALKSLPNEQLVPFAVNDQGVLSAQVNDLELFALFAAETAPESEFR